MVSTNTLLPARNKKLRRKKNQSDGSPFTGFFKEKEAPKLEHRRVLPVLHFQSPMENPMGKKPTSYGKSYGAK